MDRKFIIFRLGKEYYAVDILEIISIEKISEIVKIHKAPEYLMGVMNLRGDVIPVIDLKQILGIEKCEKTAETAALLAEIDKKRYIFPADEIVEIYSPFDEDILPVPDVFKGPEVSYAQGIVKKVDRLIVNISLGKVLSEMELGNIEKILNEA